jgi:hypothetical protein
MWGHNMTTERRIVTGTRLQELTTKTGGNTNTATNAIQHTMPDRKIRKRRMTSIPDMLWKCIELLLEIRTLGISLNKGASLQISWYNRQIVTTQRQFGHRVKKQGKIFKQRSPNMPVV